MKKILVYLTATLIFNTAISGVLYLLMPSTTFRHHFIFAQCIGLSISLINGGIVRRIQRGIGRIAVLAISLPISVAIGITLAYSATGVGDWSSPHAWQAMVPGLFFGLIGAIAYL